MLQIRRHFDLASLAVIGRQEPSVGPGQMVVDRDAGRDRQRASLLFHCLHGVPRQVQKYLGQPAFVGK